MSFNIPPVKNRAKKRESFVNHILQTVLVKVEYDNVFSHKDLASRILPILSTLYPNRSQEFAKIIRLEKGVMSDLNVEHVVLTDNNGNSVKIAPTFFAVEYNQYSNFDQLLSVLNHIVKAYSDLYKDNKITRIGVRKVNSYDMKELDKLADFSGFFNEYLIRHLDSTVISDLAEDMHSLIVHEVGHTICLRYGSVKGIMNELPARRFFLDIDCFTIECASVGKIISKLKKMNDRVFDVFCWSIGETLVKDVLEKEVGK